MFNSFGNIFRLTSFGESHGKGIGGVIDGFPAGIVIDEEFVQQELSRRRPGQSVITTSRKEADKVEFLSGIFEGKSTGCPIGFIVWNENQHSNDYNNLEKVYRPSQRRLHIHRKYGIRDHRGGGRSSARETISRVVAVHWPISITPIGYSHHGIYFTGRSYKTGRQLHGLRSGLDRNQPGALSRSGESKRNARPDLQNQRRRRYHWRCTDLCHQRLSYRTWATRIRQAPCCIGQCYAKHQCRKGF